MLVMGMSFTSCSDDDRPGIPSTETINEHLKGQWFLVKEDFCDGEWVIWDYNNQTECGITHDGEYEEPRRLAISRSDSDDRLFRFHEFIYINGNWSTFNSDSYKIENNIIEQDSSEYYSYKKYISTLTNESLVIIEEYEDEEGSDMTIFTYRRDRD